MNYSLAKELYSAGFPMKQVGETKQVDLGWSLDTQQTFAFPTLEEIIEACADGFEQLWNVRKDDCADDHEWEAHTKGFCMVGKTPSEAVARLWLALNKK